MKFKQIAVAVDGAGDESLYVLTEEGFLYQQVGAGEKVTEPNGRVWTKWTYWWEPLDLPIGDPRVKKGETE